MAIESDYANKARQSLAGAQSEFANGRFDNCANRCYYACFQAAIAALEAASIRPSGRSERWEHSFVQSQFAGLLIHRRKLYPGELQQSLMINMRVRESADYLRAAISRSEARRALTRAEAFVYTVIDSGTL